MVMVSEMTVIFSVVTVSVKVMIEVVMMEMTVIFLSDDGGDGGDDPLLQDDGERRRHFERSRVSDHGDTFSICNCIFFTLTHIE